MKRLICILITSVCIASSANIRLTLGHSDKLNLSGIPGTLYVEDPAVLDYEFHKPNWLIIKAKGVGQTKLYAIDAGGKIDKSYVVSVHYPLLLLENIIKSLFPQAKVKFNSVPKHLLVEGSASSFQEHQKILEQIYANVPKEQVVDRIEYPDIVMNEPSRQINLRVRIVEVRRVVSKALGINWDIQSRVTDSNGTPWFRFQGPNAMGYTNLNTDGSIGNVVQNSSNTFTTNIKSDLLNIVGMIDLLESDNFATTVQEPNLTVKAGESASFSAGGSVPITRSSSTQFVAGNVGYQDYGINLSYQADFDEQDPKLIKLSVTPSVSDVLPSNNGSNPKILRKEAKTVVELRSGQSIAIAGLVSSTTNSNRNGVPGLSTMPIIGDAFRSEDYSRLETEVVFIITPYIVHATQNGMLQDSMDNTGMPKSTILNSGFIVGDDDEE